VAASLRHGEQPGSDRAVRLRALGQLWSHGVGVDWTKQGGWDGRRRVALPGHPLDRRRYWLDALAPAAGAADSARRVEERKPLDDWFYAPLWKQTPALDQGADAFAGRRVVVFGGRDAAPLADRLRAAGAEVVRVEPGDAYRDAEAYFTVRPAAPGDCEALARALAARGWAGATHTLHLWGLDEPAAELDADAVERGMEHGLFALLPWIQAAGEAGLLGEGSTLLGATRGAQAVLGTEALRPWQATLSPLLTVATQEYPGVRARAVDVEGAWEEAVLAEAAQLAAGAAADEPEVAYRGRGRWTRWYAPLPAAARPEGGLVRLRERGVYLVTGGLGDIGLVLGRHLAEAARARLVLTGRRGLPERERWDAWIAEHGEADETSHAIHAVREMEALGAEVRVAAVDVTDAEGMRALVAEVAAEWGGIHGVVHAAGARPGGTLQLKTREALARVLAPKVAGTLVLDAATEDFPLDFFLLCSSVHALYGGVGLVDHCAANAFEDAFALWRGARGGRLVTSVNWDAWTEVGMGLAAVARLSRAQADAQAQADAPAEPVAHPLLGSRRRSGDGWEYAAELAAATHWVLDEHRIGGRAALPGTAYLEMARAAFADRVPEGAPQLEQVVFLAPLFVPEGGARTVVLRLDSVEGGFAFRVASRGAEGGAEQEHARGRVRAAEVESSASVDIDAVRARCAEVDLSAVAASASGAELRFGPRFSGTLRRVWRGAGELVAELALPDAFAGDVEELGLHPALLDGATGFLRQASDALFLPLAYERVRVNGPLPAHVFSHVRFADADGEARDTLSCDVTLTDSAGEVRVVIEGYTLRRVGAQAAASAAAAAPAASGSAGPAAAANGAAGRVAPDAPLAVRLIASGTGISPREGAEAFDRILAHGFGPRVAVSTRDLPSIVQQALHITRRELEEALGRGGARTPHVRPSGAAPFVEPRTELERTIAEMYQRALGIAPIGADDDFFEMGGDSLLATQLLSALNERFRVDLPLRALFESTTPARLAVAIVQRQAEQLDGDLLASVLAELQA
jgi:phthiocerol/phenolphthiocerol synthesis type-I polyketide synthase E